MNIGLISDTHSYIHPGVLTFLESCNEIWHCGDIGNMNIIEQLQSIAPVRAVHGNIDSGDIIQTFPLFQSFSANGLKVLMMHIGGYPGAYTHKAKQLIKAEHPELFVCGHSHILKVIFDKSFGCLCMNPGAAGKFGFHKYITALRFKITNKKPTNLEIYEYLRHP